MGDEFGEFQAETIATRLDQVIEAATDRGGFYDRKGNVWERCEFMVEAFGQGRFCIVTECDEATSNAWPLVSIGWCMGDNQTPDLMLNAEQVDAVFPHLAAVIARSQGGIILTRPEPHG